MGDSKSDDVHRLKKSVLNLFEKGVNQNRTTDNEPSSNKQHEELFTKETFVVSKEDLDKITDVFYHKYIYGDEYSDPDATPPSASLFNEPKGVDNQMLPDAGFNVISDGNDEDDDDDYEADNIKEQIYDDIEDVHYNDEIDNNADGGVTEDPEFDKTNYIYEPPYEYKNKFLLYLFKSSPIVLIFLLLLLISTLVSKDFWVNIKNMTSITSQETNANLSPFLTHKIYLLEEEVKSLKNLQNLDKRFGYIENEFNDIKNHLNTIEKSLSPEGIHHISVDGADPNLVALLFEKLNMLEGKVESLSKDLVEEILNKSIPKELKDQPDRIVINDDSKHTYIKNRHQSQQSKLISKYYNIANKCRVIRQLTSYPPISQYRGKRRKTVQSRIIHGFPDFIKRVLGSSNNESAQNFKTLGNIKLLSSTNSPKNVLSEQPTLFWQNVASSMPIYFSIEVSEKPVKIHELGIYHSRQHPKFHKFDDSINEEIRKRWFKTAPKDVEFLVRPIESQFVQMKESLSKFYNQDLNFTFKNKKAHDADLEGWVRVGQIKYDINSNRAYQSLIWNKEVQLGMQEWWINDVMVIIHSNWGDEIVVLDTLRVYQETEREIGGGYENPDRGYATVDDDDDGDEDDEVLFLGEEY